MRKMGHEIIRDRQKKARTEEKHAGLKRKTAQRKNNPAEAKHSYPGLCLIFHLSLICLIAAGSWPQPAQAQNLRSLPLSGVCGGIGDACVAHQPHAGAGYTNPASFGEVGGSMLSLSATMFSLAKLRLQRDYSDMPVLYNEQESRSMSSTALIPSSMTYAMSWGDIWQLALAGSVIVPTYSSWTLEDSLLADNADSSGGVYSLVQDRFYLRRVLIGPSVALFHQPSGFSVGASLFFGISQYQTQGYIALDDYYTGSLVASNTIVHSSTGTALQLSGVLGLAWTGLDWLRLGASVKSKLADLSGQGRGRVGFAAVGSLVSGSLDEVVSSTWRSFSVPDPLELRGGFGVWLGEVELFAEVQALLVFEDPLLTSSTGTVDQLRGNASPTSWSYTMEMRLAMRSTVNFSLGLRFPLTEDLLLSIGGLTDRSNSGEETEAPDPGESNAYLSSQRWPKQDRYFGTLGAHLRSGDLRLDLSLQAGAALYSSDDFYSFGWDKALVSPVFRLVFSGGVDLGMFLAGP